MDKKNFNTVIPFPKPIRHRDGWHRLCCSCGADYVKPYVAGTVRGLRGEACLPCWMNEGMPK